MFSALVPTDLGGGGATHEEMCVFLRRVAHRCPSTALALSMHQHLVAAAANDKAGRLGRALLEKVAQSEAVLVSRGANDWLSSNGSARRVERGYRVSAVKPFASGSPAGHVLVTSAAKDGPEGAQVLHFPVPLSAGGVHGLDDWRRRHAGDRLADDPPRRRFRPRRGDRSASAPGTIPPGVRRILAVALPLIMSVYVGVAERAARVAFDGADPKDPASASLAGEMETRLTAAQLATDEMVGRARGYAFTPDERLADASLRCKALAAEAATAAVDTALSLAGGAGFMRRKGLERLWRDVQRRPLPPVAVRPAEALHRPARTGPRPGLGRGR